MRPAWLLGVAAAAALAGCAPPEVPAPERLAILRFDNLSADSQFRWLERAIPEQLQVQLRGPRRTVLFLPHDDVSGQRYQAVSAGATRIVSGSYAIEGGRLTVTATVEEPGAPRRLLEIERSGAADTGVIPVVAGIARTLDPTPRSFTTTSPQAFEHYCRGLLARSGAESRTHFQQAMDADPDFGLPYVGALQAAAAVGDRAWADQVLERARNRRLRDEIDAARVGAEGAALTGDRVMLAESLGRLAELLQDPGLMARAGESRTRAGQFPAAVALFQRALKFYPDNIEVLNQLAYAQGYAGNLDAALAAADRYRRVRPDDANALDTRGDMLYLHNRYREAAADYRAAFQMSPDFADGIALYKAAFALLWAGDRDAADAAFAGYARVREEKKDRQIPLRRAEWEYLSGRRGAGLARLENWLREPGTPPVLRAIGHAQAAFWRWEAGDRGPARIHGESAAKLGSQSPIVVLAGFVTQSAASPGEWIRRAGELFARQPRAAALRPTFLSVALLMGGHFREAEAPLAEWMEQSYGQPGDPVRVFRAWALSENSRWDEAEPLVATTPLIPATGMPVLAYLGFPRLFQLRAAIAQRAGRPQEAAQLAQLWERYRR